jgi:uncharacterized membrane protein
MLHPVLRLLATRPQWLAEHAEAYAELAAAEFDDAAASWRRSVGLSALTLCALSVGGALAGVALMLWAVTPVLPERTAWVLLATPAVPLLLALAGVVAQRLARRQALFAVLRQQVQADLLLLREAGAQ